jgi:aryl-alcohol dehydrogenase-like predicted oxidoreductase
VRAVAAETGRSPAEVALAWVTRRPGVTSTIVGATRVEQLDANLAALALELTPAQRERLDAASRPEPGHPYVFFGEPFTGMINGARVRAWGA